MSIALLIEIVNEVFSDINIIKNYIKRLTSLSENFIF